MEELSRDYFILFLAAISLALPTIYWMGLI